MKKKTADISLSDPSSKNAQDLWESIILPLIKSKQEYSGTIEAQQLFFDIIYLMMLAHIQVTGPLGEKNINALLANVLDDINVGNINCLNQSEFYEFSSPKVS